MQPDGPPLMSFLEPGLQGQQLGLVLRGWGSRGSEGAGKGEEGLRGLGFSRVTFSPCLLLFLQFST